MIQFPGGSEQQRIQYGYGLLDLSAISLSEMRKLDPAALHLSIRHAVARTAHIPVTASGSSGGTKHVS